MKPNWHYATASWPKPAARNKALNTRLTASEQTIGELRIENAQLNARSTQ